MNETVDPCPLVYSTRNVVLICVFAIIFCLSVIGNSVIIVIITQQRWMRTVTNIYLLNLAIADLLLSVVCMPPTLTGQVLHCFIFPTFICPLLAYFQPVAVTASMYTLTVIAIERYYAICRPLHSLHWQTQSHAWRMITIVWLISLIINLPWLFLLEAYELDIGKWNCRTYMGDFWNYVQLTNMIFIVFALFIIPSVVMVVLYSIVIHTLRAGMSIEKEQLSADNEDGTSGGTSTPTSPTKRFRSIVDRVTTSVRRKISRSAASRSYDSAGPNSDTMMLSSKVRRPIVTSPSDTKAEQPLQTPHINNNTALNLRSTHAERSLAVKKRVIVMLLCVVIEFFICWTPLFTFLMFNEINKVANKRFMEQMKWAGKYDLIAMFQCLSYISSCCNPITYCFLNAKFRHAAMFMFGCGRFARNEPTTRTVNNQTVNANVQRRASSYATNGQAGGHSTLNSMSNSYPTSNTNNNQLKLSLQPPTNPHQYRDRLQTLREDSETGSPTKTVMTNGVSPIRSTDSTIVNGELIPQ